MVADAAAILAAVGTMNASRPHLVVAPNKPLVSLSGVWRSWGRGKKRWAVLRGIDLEIVPGTVTSISGPNGAGKTTLLRIVTGILAPDRGTVAVDGLSPEGSWREYHRRIGFLSGGDRGLYARVTVRVRQHLEYWAALAFVPRGDRKALIQDALVGFGLSDLADRRADRLSQGQRQRLRLALAVVHRPKLLILDEPRNSLDCDGQSLMDAVLGDLVRRGGAVICCGPTGEDQLAHSSRRAVLEEGLLRWE